jgi:hypothetical protein
MAVFEIWDTNLAKCEVTPQAIRPIAWSLTLRGGPKTPSANYSPLDSKFYTIDKADIITGCVGKQVRTRGLCVCDHSRHVEVLLATVHEDIFVNFRPRNVSKAPSVV